MLRIILKVIQLTLVTSTPSFPLLRKPQDEKFEKLRNCREKFSQFLEGFREIRKKREGNIKTQRALCVSIIVFFFNYRYTTTVEDEAVWQGKEGTYPTGGHYQNARDIRNVGKERSVFAEQDQP